MLQSWIHDIKQSLSATITGYLLQAVAVVPFLIALGFATAAALIWLKSVLGDMAAYLVVAVIFALIGVVVLMIARRFEEGSHTSEPVREEAATRQSLFDGSLGTIAGLLMSNPRLAFSALRVLVRNLPALIAGALLGGLLLSDMRKRDDPTRRVIPTPTPS